MSHSAGNIKGYVSKSLFARHCSNTPPPARRKLTADFFYNMVEGIKLRIQGMDKAQSPLLAWPVERVARPATLVCLRCRSWVGVRPQGFVFQGSSGLVPARRNRAGVGLQGGATALGLFSLLLVQFFWRTWLFASSVGTLFNDQNARTSTFSKRTL